MTMHVNKIILEDSLFTSFDYDDSDSLVNGSNGTVKELELNLDALKFKPWFYGKVKERFPNVKKVEMKIGKEKDVFDVSFYNLRV